MTYLWFIARNANGQARLMHAMVPGEHFTLCGVYVGHWSRYKMNYIPGFACIKCATKAGLITKSKTTVKCHLRSA